MFLVILTAFIIILLSWFIKISYETISFYWLSPRRIKKIMEKQGVHGPKPRPLLGNLLGISSLVASSTSVDMPTISHNIVSRLLPHYLLWSHKYGKRFIYWHGFEPRMCLTDPDLIKELLTKYNHVSGKSWLQQQGSKHFIGNGLLMANGDSWYHQRLIVSPTFMSDKLKGYAEQVVECTTITLKSLQDMIEKGENEVEIGELMARLTADIISRIEFGSSHEKGKKIFDLLNHLQHRCAQSTKHLCIPGSRFFPSKYNKEIKTLKKEVERLLMEIIESRKRCVEMGRSDSSNENDLLGILMNELQKDIDNSNGFLNMQLIMDECKTFFFAGHETTALLLTWTVMLLATNIEWQQKLRDEITQVCNGATPSLDHFPKLRLLSMIINESLRLYPPATLLPRMAFEDIKLGDLFIPKGLSIWIPVLAIHHDKELWGEDVNEFNPHRFASKSFISSRFIPFGGGPRNCIGQSFAILEAKIILAMLISKFKFTMSDNYRHAPMVVLTIKPKYGVPVCLTPL
ncbi:cytokinin hydroxylase-like [Silene latifolia]|uniref:cytokinin hydroxylase-like n=1 Tax=Silene latifolia TaxID=37657 RepID=UPI003D76F6F3